MSRRQQFFTAEGLEPEPRELTEKDRAVMRRWKTTIGQCVWCLYSGDLWSFATFHLERKGRTVNESKCRCPSCGVEAIRKTLIKIYEMDMSAYGEYFWGRVFGGEHDKVSWDALKARLKENFSYSDVQPFWDAYWARKALSLGGWEQDDDDEDYEDYLEHVVEDGPQ